MGHSHIITYPFPHPEKNTTPAFRRKNPLPSRPNHITNPLVRPLCPIFLSFLRPPFPPLHFSCVLSVKNRSEKIFTCPPSRKMPTGQISTKKVLPSADFFRSRKNAVTAISKIKFRPLHFCDRNLVAGLQKKSERKMKSKTVFIL